MKYRKLDASGDYTLGTGSDFFIDSADAVAQAVQTRLRLYTGEWFLDLTEGTPWQTGVLGKYTQQGYDAVMKDRILGTEGVREIVSYSSRLDSRLRALSITATISTIYGAATVAATL